MIILKLLGYAVGSVLMYWGILLLLLSPWLLSVLLIMLVNYGWNKITGTNEEWKWFVNWSGTVIEAINRWEFKRIGWIPGILIQVWYAGYAAHQVQLSTSGLSATHAIAIHGVGICGMVLAAVVFYWLYMHVVEVKLETWMYVLVGVVSLGAYGVLLQQPHIATLLSDSWQRVFTALLVEATQ